MATLEQKSANNCTDDDTEDNTLGTGTYQGIKIGQSVVTMPKMIDGENMQHRHQKKCSCPIFLPYGRFIFWWDVFLTTLLLFSIVEIPYHLAFNIESSPADPIAIIGFFIDLCLTVDIIINFRTAFIDRYDRLRVIVHPKLIAKRYLSTWFIIDFLASTPFTYVIFIISSNGETAANSLKYLSILRILKLVRIIKVLKTFHHFRETSFHLPRMDGRRTRTALKLFRIICVMVVTAHYFACFWYGIGNWVQQTMPNEASWIDIIHDNGHGDSDDFTKYSYAFYWAIVTLFTTGYGDIAARNIYEQWTCSVGILVGSCLFAYFIGVLTTGLGDDLRHQSKRERLEQSMSFCAHYNLPKELRRAVITHMRYFNSYNYMFDYQTTMDSLPNYLKKSIEQYLAMSVLKELDIFESLPASIVGQIALRLKAKSVGGEQILYEKGEIGRELYIQRTGKSKLTFDGNNALSPNKYRILKRGDVCGENAILDRKRMCTVVCISWSEFYVLDINDIIDVLKINYDIKTAREEWIKIKNTIKNTFEDSKYFRSSAELSDWNDGAPFHRHVRFKTVDIPFDSFVDPRFVNEKNQATASFVTDRDAMNKSFSDYEQELERQDERESEKHKLEAAKKGPSFKSLQNLFTINMKKQSSYSRNKNQMRHYTKLKNNDLTKYQHVSFDDNDIQIDGDDDDYLFDNHIEPVLSAGFFGGVGKSNDMFSPESSSHGVRSPLYGLKSGGGDITKSPTKSAQENSNIKRNNHHGALGALDALDDSKTEDNDMVEITEMSKLDDKEELENVENEKNGNNDTREDNLESGECGRNIDKRLTQDDISDESLLK